MGLLEDILKDPKIREAMASRELQRQGSVMGKEKDTSSPLMGTINDLLKILNPVDWMGGPGQAILGPIRTAGQKQIAKTLAKNAPELLKEAIASKRMLHITAPQPLSKAAKEMTKTLPPNLEGGGQELINVVMKEMRQKYPQYATYGMYQDALNPSFGGTMTLNPNTLRGLSPKGTRTPTTLSQVAEHELTHFLTAPQTKALTPSQGMDVGMALESLLGPHGKSYVREHIRSGDSERAASEALSYLSEVPGAKELFMKLRPTLPTPQTGAVGTAGGISGMGVKDLPLHKTLTDLGAIKPEDVGMWRDFIESLSLLGGK